eukprot:767734-Hanusia_phi.AAC.13
MEDLDSEVEEDELHRLDDRLVLREKRETEQCCLSSSKIKNLSNEISSCVSMAQLGEQTINCFAGLAAGATHNGFSSIEDYFEGRGGEKLWNNSDVVEEEVLVASMREISASKKQYDLFIPDAGKVPLPVVIKENLKGPSWPVETFDPPCEKSHLLPHWWPFCICRDPVAFFAANLVDSMAGRWRGLRWRGRSKFKRRDPESILAVDVLTEHLNGTQRTEGRQATGNK